MTRARLEIIDLAKAMTTSAGVGNLEPLPGIFPDQSAPVVRNTDDGRELALMRWGMPSPSFALKNRKTDTGVTNVRNIGSPALAPLARAGASLRRALLELLRVGRAHR